MLLFVRKAKSLTSQNGPFVRSVSLCRLLVCEDDLRYMNLVFELNREWRVDQTRIGQAFM